MHYQFKNNKAMVHILVGAKAIEHFNNCEWREIETDIFDDENGNLIMWNKENDSVGVLLDMLRGHDDFIELSNEDLEQIIINTNIQRLND